ncbi:multicopper oxidase domain-containing protein [Dactylosporangium sp. CA-139114]|uniref:multicopper oxidase domain-containing protein n=1 Tax=Dactylosporangium sp. CA-139114 TaxID=3239931 RepID=UPI003D985E98
MTGGWALVDDRVTIGLPVAVGPLTLAALTAVRGRAGAVAGQLAAAGVLTSAWLAWVPQHPSDAPAVAAAVTVALATVAAWAALRRRGHRTGTPALVVVGALLIVPAAAVLFLPGRPTQPADWGGGPRTARAPHAADIDRLTGARCACAPGSSSTWYDITFRADNPGVWMDHCHNFEHAAEGMTWHLACIGVTAPHHHTGAATE